MKVIRVRSCWRPIDSKGRRRAQLFYLAPGTTHKVYYSGPRPRTGPYPTEKQMVHWHDELARIAWEWERDLNSRSRDALVYMPIVTAASKFIVHSSGFRKPQTVERYDRTLRKFTSWILETKGRCNVSALRTADFAGYRDYLLTGAKIVSAATVNCVLYDLSSWMKWCLGESFVIQNWANKANKAKGELNAVGNSPLALKGADEFWALINSLDNDFQVAVVGLLACTGMRIGELRWMRWEDSWDYHTGTLAIGARMDDTSTKKHGRMQPVPNITRHYLQMLRCMQQGPYVAGIRLGFDKITTQVGTWLKPRGLTPKNLRCWCRTAMVTVQRLNPDTCPRGNTIINDFLGHMMTRTRAAYERLTDIEGTFPLVNAFSKWLMAARPDPDKPRVVPPDPPRTTIWDLKHGYGRMLPDEDPTF